jgi:hypothetical protein
MLRSGPDPVLHLNPPQEIDLGQQRAKIDLINSLNEHHRLGREEDTDLSARIAAYELAFRMQSKAPEVVGPAVGGARRALRTDLLRRRQPVGRPLGPRG